MKVAIIGGAGVRTPLLVDGLTRSDLPIDEIALFDIDRDRLATIAGVAGAYSNAVRAYDEAPACISGASFVFLSIRVGGIDARARDERIAVAHGVVGQETVGPAGFAMAMRTIPHAVGYARLVETEAPGAWLINFTNPVSVITQAIAVETKAKTIGICDTPTELFEDAAHVLGFEASRCYFDYFGLNHLGWLREVYCDGVPQLARVWDEPDAVTRIYRTPLFDVGFLRTLRLLPTEYLYFYYSPEKALEHLRAAGQTRGGTIAALNEELFRDLAAGSDRRAIYERYLAARSASYMQLESGSAARRSLGEGGPSALTGYDKIALNVVCAIHFNANAIIPLDVRNGGAIRDLDDADIVEVPCVVNAAGARPLAVGAIPETVEDLIMRVKDYEWLTAHAATTRADDDAVRALARNPLVDDMALAERLVAALKPW
jgi:6-phospho-beta-glucosidase